MGIEIFDDVPGLLHCSGSNEDVTDPDSENGDIAKEAFIYYVTRFFKFFNPSPPLSQPVTNGCTHILLTNRI